MFNIFSMKLFDDLINLFYGRQSVIARTSPAHRPHIATHIATHMVG